MLLESPDQKEHEQSRGLKKTGFRMLKHSLNLMPAYSGKPLQKIVS
jgi:hypothetical protein